MTSIPSRDIVIEVWILGLGGVKLLRIFELRGSFYEESEWLSVSVLLVQLDLSEEREFML